MRTVNPILAALLAVMASLVFDLSRHLFTIPSSLDVRAE
jgi:hypothetical protein